MTDNSVQIIRAVYSAAGLTRTGDACVTLTGADRVAFLHNLCSQDIKNLRLGRSADALFLTHKGRMLHAACVFQAPDALILLTPAPHAAPLAEYISSVIIMEDAACVNDSAAFDVFHLTGPRAEEIVANIPDIHAVPRKRSILPGWDIVVPSGRSTQIWSELEKRVCAAGGAVYDDTVADVLRIEAFLPKFGVDFAADQLPQEAALEVRAVSFNKGCYTGQEVVARIKTYGGVNRRLAGFEHDGDVPAPGDPLFADGAEAARITSAARSIQSGRACAIVLASKKFHAPGTRLRIGDPAGLEVTLRDIA